MSGPPRHLEEVPKGASYADVAAGTDAMVKAILESQRGEHPGLGGAVLAGALSAATRYQLQGMPETTAAFQVLQVMAPLIQNVAIQMVDARSLRTGRKPPPIPPANPQQSAFERLQKCLTAAPVPTFVLWHDDKVFLVSLEFGPGFVRSHATEADVHETMKDPAHVVDVHCIESLAVWSVQGMGADTRDALFQQVQGFLAGKEVKTVLEVLCDCIAMAVGVVADDLAGAERLLRELLPDIQATLQANWDGIRGEMGGHVDG